METKQIEFGSLDYRKELILRDVVLRKPLGLSLFDEDLTAEAADVHFGAFVNDRLIAVLLLTKLNGSDIKMRQVAVDEDFRLLKAGTKLVQIAESYARNAGYRKMVLNARKTAIGFYEKLGCQKQGDIFTEVGIAHLKMQKYLI
jgi:predicted GNAT family N-acyltransferase